MYVFLCYLLYFVYYINKYGFIILKYYVFDLLLCKFSLLTGSNKNVF